MRMVTRLATLVAENVVLILGLMDCVVKDDREVLDLLDWFDLPPPATETEESLVLYFRGLDVEVWVTVSIGFVMVRRHSCSA